MTISKDERQGWSSIKERPKGKAISKRAGDKKSAGTGGLMGKMGHCVPNDRTVRGLRAPGQPDFCIWRAVECR